METGYADNAYMCNLIRTMQRRLKKSKPVPIIEAGLSPLVWERLLTLVSAELARDSQ